MKKLIVAADITCDLDEKLLEEYDIEVIPGHISLPDGSEIRSYTRWDRWTRDEFYSELKKKPESFSTSPANVTEYAEFFEGFVKDGCDVIALIISSGISGAYNFACQAKNIVKEKYPEANIEVIDTLRFGPGFGLMTVHAAIMRREGKSLSEIYEYIETNKNRYHQAGWLDDLSFVAKKGRLTHAKAFFGSLAGVKPIGEFDYNGLTTVIGKAKGAKSAYSALLDYIGETIEAPEEQIIFIAQSNRLPQAEAYKQMIEDRFRPKAVYIKDVYPACGINIGPGLMAAYYIGKPISEGLSAEKEILEKYLNAGGTQK